MSDNINEVRERLERACAAVPGSLLERDVGTLLADHARLQAQLDAAARSLRTIADHAGRREFMETICEVRGYANSRAGVAESASAVQP